MKLLEPGRLGGLTLKNRVVMAAMGVSRLEETGGLWGEGMLAYYRARAEGGVGMVTTHSVFISQELEPFTRNSFNLYSDEHLASMRALADCLHAADCKFCVQLTAGFGRVTMRLTPDVAPVSASEVQCDRFPQATARALTTAEAETLAQDFGRAALRCREAGADCIELHGHEGYLLDQFMTALWNQRTDKYGGSREKRLTFTREAIQAVRRAVGPDFPIIYRFGVDHYLPGGRDLEEGLWIAGELEKMGVDALHVDAGAKENSWWPHPPMYQPPGCMLDLAEKVKQVSSLPVIAVGRLDRPAVAEQAMVDGKADFIAIGRGLLADADWVNKVRDGLVETIIPCIGCHDGCLGAMMHQRPIGCSVNPPCGHEVEWRVTPLKNRRRLLVVGGGPAGVEAARLGALRGFEVALWEQTDRIGGNLRAAGRPDFKQDLRDYSDYLSGLVNRLLVEVTLNRKATPDAVLQEAADYVVLATGACMGPPLLTPVAGMPLISAYDVMRGAEVPGDRVTVIGAGVIGCETAVYLAGAGKQVTLVLNFPDEGLATNLEIRANREMLILMMLQAGVSILPETVPVRLKPGTVVARQRDAEIEFAADAVVHASLMLPVCDLADQLSGRHGGVLNVGDSCQPGGVIDAVWGAFHAVREIEA
jgi:2-enoate reductase